MRRAGRAVQCRSFTPLESGPPAPLRFITSPVLTEWPFMSTVKKIASQTRVI
uniref:Uncharacterized protein n=1 Tax=Anguilla anguilla TaxID=7936 RepID=A0A0E9UPA4_ANGAN